MDFTKLLADACYFYKWTLEFAMNMPARSFFKFLTHGRAIEAHNYLALSQISAISIGGSKWYETITEQWHEQQSIGQINAIRRAKPNTVDFSQNMDTAKALLMKSFAQTREHTFGRKKPNGGFGNNPQSKPRR